MAAQPVRQPRQPGDPLPPDRPGDLGADRGQDHRVRLRHRHRRHHQRRGALPQGAQARRARSSARTPRAASCSGGAPHSWKVEGIGEDFVPKTFNGQLVDEWIRIGDAESFHFARQLSRREGILAGGSSGTNVAAALKYARRCTADDLIVTLVCDTGRNYLSKFYDDAWLTANNLTETDQPAQSIKDLLVLRGPRNLVHIHPDATVADAIGLMQTSGISQLPVLQDGR